MDDLVPAQSLIQGGDEAVSESQRIAIQSDAIFAEVIVTQTRGATTAERVRVYRYDGVATDTPKLTYRGWGRAAFFPDAPKADDEEGNDR